MAGHVRRGGGQCPAAARGSTGIAARDTGTPARVTHAPGIGSHDDGGAAQHALPLAQLTSLAQFAQSSICNAFGPPRT